MSEQWKKIIIDGEETNYSVSSDGRIHNDKLDRILNGSYGTNEYHVVQLFLHGKSKNFQVHRLVATAFCDNPNNYTIVDHIDRDKYNNHANNLRWVDNSLNVKNAKRRQNNIQNYFTDEIDDNWHEIFNHSEYLINLSNSMVINKNTHRILKPQNRNNYQRIQLNGKMYSLHHLVWETYNQKKIPQNMQIDHIDGDKSNNYIDNLRLVTPSENMKNAHKNNENLNSIEISAYDLQGNFVKKYNTIQEAADEMGVTHAAIRTASERDGTCAGYYWLKKNQDIDFIMNMWIPEGYVQMKNHPTYCINKNGDVYNKRNKKHTPKHLRADGITEYVIIKSVRINIKDLLKENDLL